MSTTELKNKILEKLQKVDDTVLKDVLELLEFETNTGKYQISDLEREAIEVGLQQIENGQTVTHEEVLKEVNEWLNK